MTYLYICDVDKFYGILYLLDCDAQLLSRLYCISDKLAICDVVFQLRRSKTQHAKEQKELGDDLELDLRLEDRSELQTINEFNADTCGQ